MDCEFDVGGGIAIGSDGFGGLPSSLHLVELEKARRDHLSAMLALDCVFPSHRDAPKAVRYWHLRHIDDALPKPIKCRDEDATEGFASAASEREAC
jgi:hypothetical protein